MNFQFKIIFVTLLILITTLLLNSVLSLASFEKLYVSSLVSTYELAGKNLKRKIEQGIRFGKPLEQFQGMDKLLQEVVEKNPHISSIGVGTPQGTILYHIDELRIGEQFPYLLPEFGEQQGASSHLIDGKYVTFLPIADKSDRLVGIIQLSFLRDVVYQKLKSMASDNLHVLWVMMLMASVGLIVFITILITRPAKRDIRHISRMLEWPADILTLDPKFKTKDFGKKAVKSTNPQSYSYTDDEDLLDKVRMFKPDYIDTQKIKNEVYQLGWHVYKFVEHTYLMLQQIQNLRREQYYISPAYRELQECEEELVRIIEDPVIPLDDEVIQQLDTIMLQNHSLITTSRLILDTVTETEPTSPPIKFAEKEDQ